MSRTIRSVAVLMGGWTAEREVSLVSGRECAKALAALGYDVRSIDVTRDLAAMVRALTPAPDVVFNALHGRGGEDGTVQGVLEFLRVPYTHSGVLASAVAMDKPTARSVFAAAGLPLAEGRIATRDEIAAGDVLPRPYVVKPVNEGSSVGVRIVQRTDNSWAAEAKEWRYERALVERYVPGREITVAVMGDRALGALEIRPAKDFYDYDAKYAPGGSEHLMPAPIHRRAYDEALAIGVAAHRALGCRGVSRADLRYDDTAGEPGKLVLLEVNTQPGMTPTSLVPDIARHAGIEFPALVRWMVENAACDF
ncbi:MAG: D-alanine--D-alanine ligase [Alphaproteobacteria bacterium]|nr:D-alanine--D-alanine ligase [Alphaproteobacteria bacterium]MDE2512496.1 D-alanine--D-alanine ligase [Alphaproteobacteria bacterium]